MNGVDELGFSAETGRGNRRIRSEAGFRHEGRASPCLGATGSAPKWSRKAFRCLEAVGKKFGHTFELTYEDFGGIAIDKHNVSAAKGDAGRVPRGRCDSFSAPSVGPKWSAPDAKVRPEAGLLGLRKELGVYANLRPVKVLKALIDASTIKPEVLEGVDLVFYSRADGWHFTLARSGARRRLLKTCARTPWPKSSASRALLRGWRGRGGRKSPRSTSRTCSKRRASGGRSSSG